MKFTCIVNIDQPKEKVAALFADPKYLKEYQDGFQKKELLEGVAGENGAISKMYYQNGKRAMELTETILENNLPDSFLANYFHTHTENTMLSKFTALSDTQTQYIAEINYTALKGFVVKVMAFLFPGFFKKQVDKWLQNFKKFAEKQ